MQQAIPTEIDCTRAAVTAVFMFLSVSCGLRAQNASWQGGVRKGAADVEQKLIAWRRDIHQHPELGDQENRTAKLVAEHLKSLGLDVRTGVARTGVVGVLKGGRPGRTVALRADMDALPIKELTGLSFASTATAQYRGTKVPVMHACGHDTHTAMLMATADVLTEMKNEIPGTVVFIFQPAEEGSSVVEPSSGQSWGAKLMLEEGLFKQLKPDAVFGLHVLPGPSGELFYRTGATMASSDDLKIRVTGKQGHGGMPWNTIDPVTTSALIISGLQTIVSRRANLAVSPAVITIGSIHGGTGPNVVPETVDMAGTIRTYDEHARNQVKDDIRRTAERIAQSALATAEVTITDMYATTINNDDLARSMRPVLEQASGRPVSVSPLQGASEDFSFYAQAVPGLFVFLGITPRNQDPATAAPNHSPNFFVDEPALVAGVRAMSSMALAFLTGTGQARIGAK
jgi:amidohydrolase